MGLLALDLNVWKIMAILLSGILYDKDRRAPYCMLFGLVVIGLLAGFAIMEVMPGALNRRSRAKVLLAATEVSRTRIVGDAERKRRLTHRLGYGNEEHQGNPLALPSGGVSKKEIDEVVEW
ncbi:hypothetical protein Pmar_PMAR012130, partial [Perkinsus marinus ATCC 50983]